MTTLPKVADSPIMFAVMAKEFGVIVLEDADIKKTKQKDLLDMEIELRFSWVVSGCIGFSVS